MLHFGDLFQWDRFVTPSIIRTFYVLAVVLVCLTGLTNLFSALALIATSPFAGVVLVISSLIGVVVGIVMVRIAAEFVLIVFRMNEHLGAIRDQGSR